MSTFDPFVKAALEQLGRLRVEAETVEVCADALRLVYPESWLASQRPRRQLAGSGFSHPIVELLQPLADQQLTALVELGSYLSAFADAPELGDLHAGLRGDQALFEHTRLQLAFGYRLLLAGAEALRFEPLADRGRRGDIAFTWEGVLYALECYRPSLANRASVENELLLTKCRDALLSVEIPIVAELRSHRPSGQFGTEGDRRVCGSPGTRDGRGLGEWLGSIGPVGRARDIRNGRGTAWGWRRDS